MSQKILLTFCRDCDNEFLGLNDFKFFPIRAQHPDLTFNGVSYFMGIPLREKDYDRDKKSIYVGRIESIQKKSS